VTDAVAPAPRQQRAPSPGRAAWPNLLYVGTALLLLAATVAVCWFIKRQLGAAHTDAAQSNLAEAERVLAATIDQERTRASTAVAVLAEDSRVRAGVLTPVFDAATTRDLLESLRPAAGASLLALLDARGQVLAEAGAQTLREANLGVTPAFGEALAEPTTAVWTFPDRVLVVGLAAVRARAMHPAAVLVLAFEVGEAQLRAVAQALGVSGGLFVQNRLVASSSRDPELKAVLQNAVGLAEDRVHALKGPRPFLVRLSPTGASAGAARVAFMVAPGAGGAGRRGGQLLVWLPVLFLALALALVLAATADARRMPPALTLSEDPGRS